MMSFLTKLFGDPNAREVAKLRVLVDRATALEPEFTALSEEGLRGKTADFKARLEKGATLDQLLPEAFAAVREAARRTLGQRHFDVQLIGGAALHKGMIAEMRTGEGKTLTATAPVYLNALTGKGVHVITVNDYLARRDAVWMGQIYHALGLSVSCIQHAASFQYDPTFKTEPQHDENRDEIGSFRVDMDYLRPVSRREAYAADITYGTNNEFGFDFLRDNMAQRIEDTVQRTLHFTIIDEVDSILVDEARTPLIISAPAREAEDLYGKFAQIAKQLTPSDYKVDEKQRAATLTDEGITKVEQMLGMENLYVQGGMKLVHHLEQALRAQVLFKLDRDYVVKDGEIIIVDEFTGRLMQGRRYSEGLHQAIEAKEGVKVQKESVTMATITFQNYFRLYEKLSGMTGTAATEAEEFSKIYKLEVLTIPTNRVNKRTDHGDRVYKNELGKFKAVVREIKQRHEKGQPVLVGTVSIEKNELLSEMLKMEGIPHNILNAKNHAGEAEIIAQAGRRGAVTVATNMAGRGVDILLGGNPPDATEAEAVRALGGLFVIGTERHESRRIDNQLRGRSGRQGDPGETQFYVSMEDDLMRIFGSDRMKGMMDRLGLPDDEAIENGLLTKSIEAAQKKVEGHNFDIRKHLLEYDDVLNKHRMAIYRRRRELLDVASKPTVEGVRPLQALVKQAFMEECERMIALHTTSEDPSEWELDKVGEMIEQMLPVIPQVATTLKTRVTAAESKEDLVKIRTELLETLSGMVDETYAKFETAVADPGIVAEVEKVVLLRATDDLWVEHLENMDYLRHGIGLQGYGQRDPLVEYKKEAYRMFHALLAAISTRVAHTLFRVQISRQAAEPTPTAGPEKSENEPSAMHATMREPTAEELAHTDRNDPCPCGSGKKFKKCHGA